MKTILSVAVGLHWKASKYMMLKVKHQCNLIKTLKLRRDMKKTSVKKEARKKRVENPKWFDDLETKPWTIRHFPKSLRFRLKRIASKITEKTDKTYTLEELVVDVLNKAATKMEKKS